MVGLGPLTPKDHKAQCLDELTLLEASAVPPAHLVRTTVHGLGVDGQSHISLDGRLLTGCGLEW